MAPRRLKQCPNCNKTVYDLPRHFRLVHGWSKNFARYVNQQFSLRKINKTKKRKSYRKKKICPFENCGAVVYRIPQHYRHFHRLAKGSQDYLKALLMNVEDAKPLTSRPVTASASLSCKPLWAPHGMSSVSSKLSVNNASASGSSGTEDTPVQLKSHRSTASMGHATVVVHKLTADEIVRLCGMTDFIKQEPAAEDTELVDVPNSWSPTNAMNIKKEDPEAGLVEITLKVEPIDRHHEPQAASSTVLCTVPFKKEAIEPCAMGRSEHTAARDELRSSSGACNTTSVHQGSTCKSQMNDNRLPSDMSSKTSGMNVQIPDMVKSQPCLCAHCDYATYRKDELRLHLRDEHQLGLCVKCMFCDFSSLYSQRLKEHVKVEHSKEIILKRLSCDYKFSGRKLTKQKEIGEFITGQFYQIKLCDNSSPSRLRINPPQLKKNIAAQMLMCKFCDYSTAFEESLKAHQTNEHCIDEVFKCELCHHSTAFEGNLNFHQSPKYCIDKLFKCELCHYSTVFKGKLKVHQAHKHSIDKLFQCELCHYSTTFKRNLKLHQAIKHSIDKACNCGLFQYFSTRKGASI